ncbi:MAG: hypothetical protein ACOX87_04185 [Chloroflexota bacterium]|jgi:hypothetical protein
MQRSVINSAGALLAAIALLFSTGCDAPATSLPEPTQADGGTATTPTQQAEPTAIALPTRAAASATTVPTRATPPATTKPELQATPQVNPAETPVTPPVGMAAPTQADTLLEKAKEDAASRAGVPVSEVIVVRAEAVEWRDSSLGCPEPGKSYLQVITPGYSFTLRAGGNSYVYHTDRANRIVLCQNPS